MFVKMLFADPIYVLKLISKIGLWTAGGYVGILFISPFVAGSLLRIAYLVTGTRPGGPPLSTMKNVPSFNSGRDCEEINKRKLNTDLPLLKRVVQESVSYTSGLTAVLLQIAHPGIAKGIRKHSNFRTRLLERTQNTAIYINVMAFGSETEKIALRNFVNLAHRKVNDNRTENTYDSMDPQLQLWVAATIYMTMLDKYESIFCRLSELERDQVYQEFSTFGTMLQVPLSLWPENRTAFQRYWDRQIADLRVPDDALHVAQDIIHPKYVNIPHILAMILFFRHPLEMAIATEELPERVREGYGLKSTWWSRIRYAALIAFYKLTYNLYPESVRTWQRDYYLWMMRQRFAKKGKSRNGRPISFEALETSWEGVCDNVN
ncbi:hypothetical protein GX48_01540 [Paracoccidioides brasiliensis]|nr:hypothetical protein GX48_01540 [Paracoccidioides brasiliensis]